MKKQDNTKQRLFEMMSKIDSTFKPKLNEGEDYHTSSVDGARGFAQAHAEPYDKYPDYAGDDDNEEEFSPEDAEFISRQIARHNKMMEDEGMENTNEGYRGREYEYVVDLNVEDIQDQFEEYPALEQQLNQLPDGVLSFTLTGVISSQEVMIQGTASDSEMIPSVETFDLEEGSYPPEFKEWIEQWVEHNYERLDKEILNWEYNRNSPY